MTLRMARQLEGGNAIELHVDDTRLPDQIKIPLSKVRECYFVPFIVNWAWFDIDDPVCLEVFGPATRGASREGEDVRIGRAFLRFQWSQGAQLQLGRAADISAESSVRIRRERYGSIWTNLIRLPEACP